MPSFSIPLSGLDASQQALSVIANNLSNMNTVGYKDEDINFQDLFYQSLGTSGSGDALQVGAGVSVGSVSGNFTAGNVESTGVPTDVAINGNGFLVTQDGTQTQYTRAGNLEVSSDGYLTTQDGQYVMGYSASNGVINSTALSDLKVGTGSTVPASATSSFQMSMNLNASASSGTTFTTPMTVYDSLGASHVLTFTFTNTGTNGWSYTATIPDTDISKDPTTGASITATNPATPVQVASGTMTFNSSGDLTTLNGSTVGSATGDVSSATLAVASLTDGASDLSLKWNVLDSSNDSLVTQTSAGSATSASSQNGFASGTLSSFAIQSDGTIEGSYTNGQSLAIGQIVMAQFGNNDGLSRVGGNSFQSTVASGQAVVGIPGTGGLGTLTGGSLEQSNVDMATEFSAMIVNQSGFEANAKVITTFNQIEQSTINIEQG
jgi:flagellar hook protein FlgE